MSGRGYYNAFEGSGGGGSGPRQNAVRVWNNARDIAQMRDQDGMYAPTNGALRRVNAAGAQGEDMSQRFDPFGHNRYSDASNPWAAFFGSPPAPWKTASYDKYDRNNYNLPEAYSGESIYLGRTITELIYSDESYYTQVLMPIQYTNQVSVSWDKWTFNEHFTGIVPEQGVSRLVSSKREAHSDSFVRHGLAALFEHGFMSTREGRANYFLTLAQIARAVQETINFGVIYAYLTCHDYSKEYQAKHGYFKRETLRDVLRRENFMWAIFIKAEFGAEKLDAQIVEWMALNKTSADTWVLPPKPAMYLRLVPEEKVYYYKAGQDGPDRVNNVVSSKRPHEANSRDHRTQDIVEPEALFRKNRVYLSRSYHVDPLGPIDLLNKMSSVGEYFKIVRSGDDDCHVGEKYMTCHNNTRIYNEDGDTGYTVTLMEGLRNCMVFNDDGTPRVFDNLVDPVDARDLGQCFFMRSEMTANNQTEFKPIDIMGDIDPAFFGPQDVANLCRTAINSLFPAADAKDLDNKLSNGERLVRRLADMGAAPLSLAQLAAVGGANSAVARDFVEALQTLVARLNIFAGGGGLNMFLNAGNAVYGAGVEGASAGAAQVLYENLFVHDLVEVAKKGGGGGGEGGGVANDNNQAQVFAQANVSILAALNAPERGGTEHAQVHAALKVGADLNTMHQALDFIEKNPAATKASARPQVVKDFVGKMRATLASASAAATSQQTGGEARVGASRESLSRLPAGYAPVSRNVAAHGASFFEQMPIAQALFSQQQQQHQQQGASASKGQRGGFSTLFNDDDLDGDDGYGAEARVGTMFGGSDWRQEADKVTARQRNVDPGFELGGVDARLRTRTLAANLDLLSKSTASGLERAVAAVYFAMPWRRQSLENMLSRNILPNFGILGFRIGLYDMAIGIKCKAGRDTAITWFGNSRFMLSDDATTMMHYGNYTHYGKSIVHKPENVFVAYDIFPNRCLGGMGTRPYTAQSQYMPGQGKTDRDIFYVMVPYVETTFDTVMDMAGRFYSYMDSGMLDEEDPANVELHYSTAAFYNRVWNFYNEEDVTLQVDQPLYRMSSAAQNRIVWQGAQGSFNLISSEGGHNFHRNIIRNKSPWGPHVCEGSKACRDGLMERQAIVPFGVLGF